MFLELVKPSRDACFFCSYAVKTTTSIQARLKQSGRVVLARACKGNNKQSFLQGTRAFFLVLRTSLEGLCFARATTSTASPSCFRRDTPKAFRLVLCNGNNKQEGEAALVTPSSPFGCASAPKGYVLEKKTQSWPRDTCFFCNGNNKHLGAFFGKQSSSLLLLLKSCSCPLHGF